MNFSQWGNSASTGPDPTRAQWARAVRVWSGKEGGRPERATVISNDDIVNLKIALNTSTSLEDFLERT